MNIDFVYSPTAWVQANSFSRVRGTYHPLEKGGHTILLSKGDILSC